MTKKTKKGETFVLPNDIDLARVADQKAGLLAKCQAAGQDNPLGLDLSAGLPSAPALQLLIAAQKLLEARSAFSGFGPIVGPLLQKSTLTQ